MLLHSNFRLGGCKVTLMLILLTLLDNAHAENDLRAADKLTIFDFLPEADTNRVAKMSMHYDPGALSMPCTLCVWIRPGYKGTSGCLLTAKDTNNFLRIESIKGYIYASINDTGLAHFNTTQMNAYSWSHLCLALTQNNTQLYLNNLSFQMDLEEAWPYDPGQGDTEEVIVELGSDTNAFSGQMTEFKLFNRELSVDQVTQLSRCASDTLDHLASYNVSVTGAVNEESEHLHYMCQQEPKEFLALFEANLNQTSSRNFCESFEGRLINKNDNISIVADEILERKDVSGVARTVWTDEVPDEGLGEAFYAMRRAAGNIYLKLIRKASAVLPITACIIPVGKRITLKDDEVKEFYLHSRRNKLIMQSDDGGVIGMMECHRVKGNCLAYKRLGDPIGYSVVEDDRLILGRRIWHTWEDEEEYVATLSTCQDGQFTCNSSQCIELSRRCDGWPQCPDGSDEGDNCVRIQEDVSYRQMECPVVRPMVDLRVHFHGVNSIALERNEFTSILSVVVSWTDHRLAYINLHNYTRQIPSLDLKIWIPTVKFVNARFEDNLHIQTKSGVLEEYRVHALTQGRPHIRNSYEVSVNRGSEVRNMRNIQYLFTFSCEYDLFAFPFDTQECDIILQLDSSPGCNPQWNINNRGIGIKGTESTIAMYDVSRIRYFYNMSSRSNATISFKLLFFRRFEAYLLTTFGPCVILYMLSELTLTHFSLDGFTDRITVTLSLLIVIASIFSQVTSTLPSSPSPKFVDWFFFYCILRVSFVFFLHSIIDKRLRSRQEGKYGTSSSDIKKMARDAKPTPRAAEKVAWDPKPSPKNWRSRLNMAAIVNNVGIAILTLSDAVVLCLFVAWVITDQRDKIDRFQSF